MEKYNLEKNDITKENIKNILIEMFYEIRSCINSYNLSKEDYDTLCDCLDGAPKGIYGVQLLMSRLEGNSFEIVENPTTGKMEYKRKLPEDPYNIYLEINMLIDFVNGIIKKYSKTKTLK